MNPGASTSPRASTTESLELGVSCPICRTVAPTIRTSRARAGPPDPSTTRAPRISTGRGGVAAGACAIAGMAEQYTRSSERGIRRRTIWRIQIARFHPSSRPGENRYLGFMTSPAPVGTEPTLRRVIGVRGLAAAIFNITVGAAIFVLPAHMAASLGAAAPLAYLVCAVATALVALCIAEAGSRVPQSGGPYAYVGTALGPYAGFLCGVLLWLGITLAMGAVSTVFADAVAGLLPGVGGLLPRAILLVAVIASLAVVNIRGAALGSHVSGVATVAKIVPLIAFVALGLSHVRAGNLALGSFPSLSRLGESGLLLMFAFFGMESALQVSGEVRDAARAVPRAIALAVTGVGVLYISVQLVAQGILGSALAAPETAKAPLAAAAVQFEIGRAHV